MSEANKKPRANVTLGKDKNALVRFSYLHTKPHLNSESNKMECSTQLMIPKVMLDGPNKGKPNPEVKEIKDAIDSLKKQWWTDKKKTVPPLWRNPLIDPATSTNTKGKPYPEDQHGFYLLSVKTGDDENKQAKIPEIVSTTKNSEGKFVRLDHGDIKSGDWGRCPVNLSPYDKGNSGIGSYFEKIQLVQQGESLGGGRTSAEDDFSSFDSDEEDPLA